MVWIIHGEYIVSHDYFKVWPLFRVAQKWREFAFNQSFFENQNVKFVFELKKKESRFYYLFNFRILLQVLIMCFTGRSVKIQLVWKKFFRLVLNAKCSKTSTNILFSAYFFFKIYKCSLTTHCVKKYQTVTTEGITINYHCCLDHF